MSVPAGDRRESGMEFLKNARDIEEIFIDLRINKPKRYTFFFDKLLDVAFNLLSEVKAGNSIYPTEKEEAKIRQRHFKEAISQCQVLVSQIEVVHHKLQNDGISIGQIKQLATMLEKEIKLLKGIIKKDKERYSSLPD